MIGELTSLIERRRDELQQEAMCLGAQLFGKKPRKVVRPLAKSHFAS